MDFTTGSSVGTIRNAGRQIFKNNRMSLVLLALLGRVVGAGFTWYANEQLGLTEVLQSMQVSAQQNAAGLMASVQQGDAITFQSITALYGEGWNDLKAMGPTLLILGTIYMLVSMILFMLVARIVLDEAAGATTSRSEKIKSLLPQIIPYTFTVLLLSLFNIFFLGLFILPGIILGLYWMFTNIIVIHQKKYFFSAMKASRGLVSGRWRKTLGVFLVIIFLGILLITFFTSVLAYLLNILGNTALTTTGTQVVSSIFGVFLQIIIIVLYLRRYHTSSN